MIFLGPGDVSIGTLVPSERTKTQKLGFGGLRIPMYVEKEGVLDPQVNNQEKVRLADFCGTRNFCLVGWGFCGGLSVMQGRLSSLTTTNNTFQAPEFGLIKWVVGRGVSGDGWGGGGVLGGGVVWVG